MVTEHTIKLFTYNLYTNALFNIKWKSVWNCLKKISFVKNSYLFSIYFNIDNDNVIF